MDACELTGDKPNCQDLAVLRAMAGKLASWQGSAWQVGKASVANDAKTGLMPEKRA